MRVHTRSTKSARAAAVGSGASGTRCSPDTFSSARQVQRIVSCGQVASIDAMSGTASRRCSRLSSTSSRSRSARNVRSRSRSGSPGVSGTLRRWAMVGSSMAGSRTGASATTTTPSGKVSPTAPAARSARRVLPTPPVPVTVTRRISGRRNRLVTVARSSSRPTKLVRAWLAPLVSSRSPRWSWSALAERRDTVRDIVRSLY